MTTAAARATLAPSTGRSTPSDAPLASRVRVLTTVAANYHDLCDPLASGSGVPGTGESLNLTPHERHCLTLTKLGTGRQCTCAYRTVREFERLMGVMRGDRGPLVRVEIRKGGELAAVEKHSVRALRWHLLGWYVDAVRVAKHYPKPVKRGQRLSPAKDERILRDKSGAYVPAKLEIDWHRTPGARQVLADAGIVWMASRWPSWEPELPADYRSKFAA